jgi:hypothetical protein
MGGDVEMSRKTSDEEDWLPRTPRDDSSAAGDASDDDDDDDDSSSDDGDVLLPQNETLRNENDYTNGYFDDYAQAMSPGDLVMDNSSSARVVASPDHLPLSGTPRTKLPGSIVKREKKKGKKKKKKTFPRPLLPLGLADPSEGLRCKRVLRITCGFC